MFYGLAAELKRQYSPSAVKGKGQAASRTGGPVRDPAALVPPPPTTCVCLPACRRTYSPTSSPSCATKLTRLGAMVAVTSCVTLLCHPPNRVRLWEHDEREPSQRRTRYTHHRQQAAQGRLMRSALPFVARPLGALLAGRRTGRTHAAPGGDAPIVVAGTESRVCGGRNDRAALACPLCTAVAPSRAAGEGGSSPRRCHPRGARVRTRPRPRAWSWPPQPVPVEIDLDVPLLS